MQTALELLQRRPAMVIHAVGPDDAVIDAIRLMDAHDIGAVLVMQGDALVGLLSERDYARKVVLRNRSSITTRVSEIMTREVVTVASGTSLDECRKLIAQGKFRHLPVVDAGRVLGVITAGDLW